MRLDSIGKILLTVLLLATFIIGALISYLWVVGYYVSLEIQVPEKPVIVVFNPTFSPQNPSFFNVSILNPSFSPADVKILQIATLTRDNLVHEISLISPTIPSGGYVLPVGETKTFKCYWNWANYTGQVLKIFVFVEDGSGGTLQVDLPLVNVEVTDFSFDPALGDRFNLTLRNSENSAAAVAVTEITVITNTSSERVTVTEPPLPYSLAPSASATFLCRWNWTSHQGEAISIKIDTIQGYTAKSVETISTYVTLNLREITFNATDPLHFNLTVTNSETSVIHVNITRITVTLENGAIRHASSVTPPLPYGLDKNATVTFLCGWNWTDYRSKEVIITAYTSQGYKSLTRITLP